MLNKEALEYLVGIGESIEKLTMIEGLPYSHLPIHMVRTPSVDPVVLHTLDSLVTFIQDNIDGSCCGEVLAIHIESPSKVNLIGPLRDDRSREVFAAVRAELPDQIVYGRFYDTEDFNISVQSRFVDNPDKKLLLKFTGLIKEENVKQTGDDGISQAIMIRTGVVSVDQAVVPNPVSLAPWRTFQEVKQPESMFVFRMKDGPSAALFEADGGAWRLEAIRNIKEYLEEALPETVILA
jgi:hypothetical protein